MVKLITYETTSLVKTVASRVADKPIQLENGSPPRTDGRTIWIPMNDSRLEINDMLGLASHEGSHIRFRSYFNQGLFETLCPGNPEIAAYVLNIFEDFRVNILLKKAFPGFWKYLDRISESMCARNLVEMKKRLKVCKGIPDLQFILVVTAVITAINSGWNESVKGMLEELGSVIPHWDLIKDDFRYVRKYKTMTSAIISSKAFIDRLGDLLKQMISPDMKKLLQAILKELTEMIQPDKELSEELKELLKEESVDSFEEVKDGEIVKFKLKAKGKISDKLSKEISDEAKALDKELEDTFRETEEMSLADDPVKLIRITDAKVLAERITDAAKIYAEILERNFTVISELRRQLETISGSQELVRNQRSGVITSRDLYKVIASKGKFDRPFSANQKRRGVRLMIAVDESGSMGGTKIDLAREAAIILTEALKKTRIKFSVVGFSAFHGKAKIVEKVYKDFDEVTSPNKLGCISVGSSVENRDGTSLEFAVKDHFKNFDGDVPLLIVISDGAPCHEGTHYVGDVAMKETIESVRKIKQIMKVFAISFDRSGTYIEAIYGKETSVLLSNESDLLSQLSYLAKMIAKIV